MTTSVRMHEGEFRTEAEIAERKAATPAEKAPSAYNPELHAPGAVRVTFSDGKPFLEHLGVRSSREFEDRASPVRSPLGDPVSHREVRDSDLVQIGGVQMKVKQAKALGLYQEAPAQAPFVGGQPGGPRQCPGAAGAPLRAPLRPPMMARRRRP